jgi:hypothetical protein
MLKFGVDADRPVCHAVRLDFVGTTATRMLDRL